MNPKIDTQNCQQCGEPDMYCHCVKTPTHTPTPWHVGIKQAGIIIYDEKGWAIADCKVYHGNESGEPKANAAFIVRAVNAHEELLAASKRAFDLLSEQDDYGINGDIAEELKKAICRAE